MKTLIEEGRLEKYAQVVSLELMQALKAAAQARGVSIDIEIASRLIVGLTETEFNKDDNLFNRIMKQQFSHEDAIAECRQKRRAALYNYEMEKLRLFVRFEKQIPRGVKEQFVVIDVEAAIKEIRAEMAADKDSDQED